MRLAVSNIAWPSGADEKAAAVLLEQSADGVEVAPTKVWPKPLEATERDARGYRAWWEGRGLKVAALQALLFGRPDLVVFGDEAVRRDTVEYLKRVIDLASWLGAEALVFGSPKNRLVGVMEREETETIAERFFRELGDHAASRGVAFCVEANPPEYGCDFITTTADAADLVRRVGSEGFGLHVDTGGMTLSGDDPAQSLSPPLPNWRHFHVSEPHLAPVGRGGADHNAIAAAVHAAGYDRWVSIEMKEAGPDTG
jgi:sugar phosphate isomerase/epimerase